MVPDLLGYSTEDGPRGQGQHHERRKKTDEELGLRKGEFSKRKREGVEIL